MAEATDIVRITDETLERMRARVGIQMPEPRRYHNDVVTQDSARHFAWGYGDDNPLYCDAQYGLTTRWGGLIGAPAFAYTMGEDDVPPLSAEMKQQMKGDPLAGLGLYQAEMQLEWWEPLREGDRCFLRKAQVGTRLTQGRTGGKSIHEVRGIFQRNQDGNPVAMRRGTFFATERDPKRKENKRDSTPEPAPQPYTQAELDAIDACYEAEIASRRGAEPRYWEDVSVGDRIGPMVKGPLKVTDQILWHMGWGLHMSPPGAFRMTYDVRKKVPGMFPKDPMGIPDTVQRCHWQPDWAQRLGFPTAYDYGAQREVWFTHLISNWMGDDAWLWKLTAKHHKFNFLGDTTWMTGEVTAKEEIDGHKLAHVNLTGTNRAEETSSSGHAVVILPSRDGGPIDLPSPPAPDLTGLIEHQVEEYRSIYG
tara:strand:+ start:4687 stop:5949 length:1263 start_codon:yes stop_codon:yes gene_type:complete